MGFPVTAIYFGSAHGERRIARGAWRKVKDAFLRGRPSGVAEPQSRTDLQQKPSLWSRLLRAARKLLDFVRQ